MADRKNRRDKTLDVIKSALEQNYLPTHPKARIDAYRYNPACVRIRIIDPDFRSIEPFSRHEHIWPILDELPDKVTSEVSLMFLLTPQEIRKETWAKMMNLEFEEPELVN